MKNKKIIGPFGLVLFLDARKCGRICQNLRPVKTADAYEKFKNYKPTTMKTTYHAIIAGNSADFRNHIKSILKMAEKENPSVSLVLFETLTIDELERELDAHADIAFIDSQLVIRENKRLARAWRKTKSECAFALLLSDSQAADLKTVIQEMDRQNALPSEIHVLKNNYPDELITRVILRLMEYGIAQKNLAVV